MTSISDDDTDVVGAKFDNNDYHKLYNIIMI